MKINLPNYKSKNLKIYKFLSYFFIAWSLFLIFYYRNLFGGDPEIHLIFAKNFTEGYPFQFNQGFSSGGESSPLYMIIVSIIYKFLGKYTQYGMKLIGLLSLICVITIFYFSCNSINSTKKVLGISLFTSMTFIPFQALLGMENFLFSAFLLLILFVDTNFKKYSYNILLIFSALLFLLRFEGIFFSLYLFLKSIFSRNKKLFIYSILSFLVCFLLFIFLNNFSFAETSNAGLARSLLSKAYAIKIPIFFSNIFISRKVFFALLYIFPLIGLIFRYRKCLSIEQKISLFVFFFIPSFLHLFLVFPDTHISRYLIYSYVIVFFIFINSVLPKLNTLIIFILSLYIFSISFLEFNERIKNPIYNVNDSVQEMSDESIKDVSDKVFNLLSKNGQKPPIIIGSQEVNLRGRLDNRFLIWSLDGITDSYLNNFKSNNYIDHFSYIKARKIQYLEKVPNYNINKKSPSLESVTAELRDNLISELCYKDIKFTLKKIPKNVAKIFSTEDNLLYELNKCIN